MNYMCARLHPELLHLHLPEARRVISPRASAFYSICGEVDITIETNSNSSTLSETLPKFLVWLRFNECSI